MDIVKPHYFEGWNMSVAQLWGSGPKFTIICGNCYEQFSKRVAMVDNPPARCPNCGAVNVLPLKAGYG